MAAEGPALDYLLFDGTVFDFPRPWLPILPPLRSGDVRWGADASRPAPAWGDSGRFYGRARYALRDAFRLSGVGPAGTLLAPAYHCRTMIDPALALDAPVRFYAVDESLRPDLADVALQLTRTDSPVKAVVASHFFGIAYDFRELAALCRSRGVQLVEDCAQSFPLTAPSNGMGATGDLCVASPYKFLPCVEGGVLWSGDRRAHDLPPLRPPGLRAEASELNRMWERSRVRLPRDRDLPAAAKRAPDPREEQAQAVARRLVGPSHEYRRDREAIACSAVSRWIIAHADIARVLERRRANYYRWSEAAKNLPNARALRPELGPNDTPYMFPLLLDRPERHFAQLRRAGLPIYRWDSLAVSSCATAAKYRLRLLHMPCHQGLSDDELEWMFRSVRKVLSGDAAGGAPA
ncbi:MAG TPA: DegT/DnrJ/EryC1/StrS family aminotransferase [Candidatus Eisenbacteria bacterium]